MRRALFGCLCAGVLAAAGCVGSEPASTGAGGAAGTSTTGAAGSSNGGTTGSAGTSGTGGGTTGMAGTTGTAGAGAGTAGTAGTVGTAGAGGRGGAAGAAGAAGRGGSSGMTGTAGAGGGAGTAGNNAVGGSGPPPGPCLEPTRYRNLFTELLGKTQPEIDAKLAAGFQSLFHGGSNNTVYYEVGTDEAYILDVNNNDVRSEGMSYGMMIAVQLDKKTEFDRLWKWTKSHLQQSNGYFAWQANTSGQIIASTSAPDGEEYIAPALIFASKRWGDGTGIYAYAAEARSLLAALAANGNFNRSNYLVRFGNSGQSANYTDPSYVLPAFYEVWACFDTANQQFWRSAVTAARAFFPRTTNATTGLAPDFANFDGSAYNGSTFTNDAYRVVANIMMDHNLFKADSWQSTWAARYAAFFKANTTGSQFTLTGSPTNTGTSRALQAMNAMVGFGVPPADGTPFVQTLWNMPIPSGQYRYYDGMLYMLAMLHVSGSFQLFF